MTESSTSQTIAYGIRQGWLDDRRIAFFQAPGGIHEGTRRLWEHMIAKTVREWPEGQPILVIQDLTYPDAPIPRLARASEISHSMRSDQVAYSAVVIGDNTAKRMLSRVTRLRNETRSICHERVFESAQDAHAWLQSVMKTDAAPVIAAAAV